MTFNRHQLRPDISLDIDGRFHANIEVNVTPDIAIDRHLHLRRDRDAGWLIYSMPNGTENDINAEAADITVGDPAICAFLDTFYFMLADPAGFGKADFPAPQKDAA